MKTMINENELAAVVGGNDILEFDVRDDVLPTMTNQPVSLDVIDFYIHDQFTPLSCCMEPVHEKRRTRTYRSIDGRA